MEVSLNPVTLKKSVLVLAVVGTAASLAACAEDYGPRPYRYSTYEAGVVAHVDRGTVVAFRPVEFGPGDTQGATIVGGVAGGVVGNAVSHGRDRGLATAAGAVAGALIGKSIAKSDRRPGFAYTIQLDHGGRTIEVAQIDDQPIPAGAAVNVVYEGGRARVVPAGGYAPRTEGRYRDDAPPPPPPPPPRNY